MSKVVRVLKYALFLLVVLMALSSSCSPTRKNPYYQKRIKASRVNTTQLGRNRYFFSSEYQKKLVKSYKRKQ
jgi:hypothetical protein